MNILDELEELKELVNDDKKFKYKATANFILKDIKRELDYASNCHNLEESIGCPLEIVFKAIYIGIYFYDNYYKDQMMNYIPVLKYNHFECGNKPYIRYLKDYKKTWWLKEDKSE